MMSDQRYGAEAGRAAFLRAPSARTAPLATTSGRAALGAMLMAGVAGCSSSPAYPIRVGERPGDSSVIAVQPRYPMSSRDAAQDAADRASQNANQNASRTGGGPAYPAYGAPSPPPPQGSAYAVPPPAAPPPAADDTGDYTPRPAPQSSVESSDLPPPPAMPPAGAYPSPPPGSGQPQAISFGGGTIVFGTDSVGPAPLTFAAYHHHRHHAEATSPTPAADDASDARATKTAKSKRHGEAAEAEADTAPASASADTPYQTVVRPGEKLADVAARTHSSREALAALNDVKHPRHVKAGTVLKIPYRYSYDVQKGDTLYTIAHRFDQDPQVIAKLNGLKAVPTLQPGQSITLPPDAQDKGKRDHAAAGGPSPVAAPEKLADAALRKAERHGRHRHGATLAAETPAKTAEPTVAVAELPAEPPTHGRRGRRAHREAALAAAASASAPIPAPVLTPPPAAVATAEAGPHGAVAERPLSPPSETPVTTSALAAPSPSTYAGVRPTPAVPPAIAPASGVVAGYGYRAAAPTPAPALSYSMATTALAPRSPVQTAPAYAVPPSATPSYVPTYASPAYSPRSAAVASDDTRVASLNTPRYAPTASAGSFSPSLGRERPSAPALSAGAMTPTEIAAAGRGRFVWPLRGQLISTFGDKGTGQHNDGVDIAAIPGAGVRAAAAGEVVYAGSSIPGFGNLVLVKHPGGWVTAYAHLDRIEVRMRDAVSQGEEIGQAGQTGAVDRPQLHFEVRYAPDPADKARPVDPTLVLPSG